MKEGEQRRKSRQRIGEVSGSSTADPHVTMWTMKKKYEEPVHCSMSKFLLLWLEWIHSTYW